MTRSNQLSLFPMNDQHDVGSVPTPVDAAANSLHLPAESQRLMIRASAGTGKTFQLANRFITLLRDANVDQILAATFTRKAAGEIIDRILVRIAKAAIHQDELAELRKFTGEPALTQSECLQILKDVTSNLHRVRIGTLDGFFARLAGSFSLELRLPPSWRLIDDLEVDRLRDDAIDRVLRDGEVRELRTLVHQLSKGSTQRSVHRLIADQIGLFHNLYLQANENAWNTLAEIKLPKDSDFEDAVNALRDEPIDDKRLVKARDGDLTRIEDEQWEEIYKSGLTQKVLGDGKFYKKDIPENLKAIYIRLEQMIRAKWMFLWARQTEATFQLLDRFHRVFEKLKFESGALQFDDVTRSLANSLGRYSTSSLSHRLDGAVEHVLLDEFQDTSIPQWQVIRPFAEASTTDPNSSFFCVGDAKQAIYGWRGGEASIFDALSNELENLREEPLNKSFRSSQIVIDAVNEIFTKMGRHDGFVEELPAIQAWSTAFPKHETARTELPGYVRLLTSSLPTESESGKPTPAMLDDELIRTTTRTVKQQLADHPTGTIGVLTRRNVTVGSLIYELNQLGIDASEEGGNPLTDSAAVQLVLSLFRLADHPGDTIARFHVAQSPIGAIVGLRNHENSDAAHLFSDQFRNRLLTEGYGAVVNQLASDLRAHCNEREWRRISQLVELADDFESTTPTLRPCEFADFVEQQRVQEPTDSKVRVMNVHQSKGLQFDTVFIVEFDQLFTQTPSALTWRPGPINKPEVVALYRSKNLKAYCPPALQAAFDQTTTRAVNESLCLMYVALTRAIHSLQIIVKPRISQSKENKLPKTYAGLVRAAIAPDAELTPETTLYESGHPQWFKELGPSSKTIDEPIVGIPSSIQFKRSSVTRRFQRIAPSSKETKVAVRFETLLPTGPSNGREKGTLFHAWLEEIDWIENGLPKVETLRTVADRHGLQHLDIDECLVEFQKIIARSELERLLTRETYFSEYSPIPTEILSQLDKNSIKISVFNERNFSIIQDFSLVAGSIDRLVTISSEGKILAADIIDFKTDSLPNDLIAINDRVDYYRGQLQAYRMAASKFLSIEPERITARLALLRLGKVVDV